MNAVDLIMEQFSLNPFNELMTDYNHCDKMFENGQTFLSEVITEASTGTTKGNILQKIWKAILKILEWCKKQFNRLIEFLRKTFSYKNPKSIDQIAAEAGIKLNLDEAGKIKSINEELPKDDSSDLAIDQAVNLFFKPFQVEFQQNSVKLTPVAVNIKLWTNINLGVKGQDTPLSVLLGSGVKQLIALIKNEKYSDEMVKIATLIKNKNLDRHLEMTVMNFISEVNDAAKEIKMLSFELSLDELTIFQKKLNDVMDLISVINDPDSIFYKDGESNVQDIGAVTNYQVVDGLNSFLRFVSTLQMSINCVSASISSKFTIDAAYRDTVNDPEVLSVFVQKAIDAGIPPKFIAYNAYAISKGDLKGWKGTANKPIWGQSRLIFFPETNKTNVYKIALSGWGKQSNRSEMMTSQSFKKYGGEELLASINGSTSNNCVISQERVKTFKVTQENMIKMAKPIEDINDKVSTFCSKHNIPLDLSKDIHIGNIGEKDGRIILVDYAFTNRTKMYA